MSNTQTTNQLTKGKKLGIPDYIALYKMSLRSYFWRVDNRQLMNKTKGRDSFSLAVWFLSVTLAYGLPVMFAFSVVSFIQAILLTPLRWVIPAMRMNLALHPGASLGMVLMGGFLLLICSPMVYNKERLKYNLHFAQSAWWNNTGISPRMIIMDEGLYGEYIATMSAELNMKKQGYYGRVFNSVLIPKDDGNFNEADVICVNEAGIQVIEAKYRGGTFVGRLGDRNWTQYIGKQVNPMDNPLHQNNGHINCLINYLFKNLPNGSARTKASFVYSYVNVSLLANRECDISQLSDETAPAQFFLGGAEGKDGYICLDIQSKYKIRFSKKEVDQICAALEQISGYSHEEIRNRIDQRKWEKDNGKYRYDYWYSIVRLESVTADGSTEINDLICEEAYSPKDRNKDWKEKNCVFRYFMDPSDGMFKAIPNSRRMAQSGRTQDLQEILNYYNRRK